MLTRTRTGAPLAAVPPPGGAAAGGGVTNEQLLTNILRNQDLLIQNTEEIESIKTQLATQESVLISTEDSGYRWKKYIGSSLLFFIFMLICYYGAGGGEDCQKYQDWNSTNYLFTNATCAFDSSVNIHEIKGRRFDDVYKNEVSRAQIECNSYSSCQGFGINVYMNNATDTENYTILISGTFESIDYYNDTSIDGHCYIKSTEYVKNDSKYTHCKQKQNLV